MPSLTLEGGHRRSPARAHQEERKQPEVKLLVMGKTAEDRRTLSTLLVNDHEGGGHHSSGVSDMSYSFLSTGDRSQHARSNSETSQVSGVSDNSLFSKLGCCSSSTALSHTTIDSPDIDLLVTALRRPLEQLESKLNPAYPTTETLTSLVCSAGVGEFDACLFLFSSRESPTLLCTSSKLTHFFSSSSPLRNRSRSSNLASSPYPPNSHSTSVSYLETSEDIGSIERCNSATRFSRSTLATHFLIRKTRISFSSSSWI